MIDGLLNEKLAPVMAPTTVDPYPMDPPTSDPLAMDPHVSDHPAKDPPAMVLLRLLLML